MYYVIQENTFKEVHYDLLIEMMERFNLDHEVAKYIPIVQQVDFKTKRKDVFCFGAVAMVQTAKANDWYPGSMFNENHDFEVYAPKYGMENMLNSDGKVMKFTDLLPIDDEVFFARLTKDSKYFGGAIYSRESWNEHVNTYNENKMTETILNESNILVSSLKDIQQEVRCWVVGGKVITASRYKLGSQVIYQNYDDELFFIDFAQRMVDKYQPAEAFVLDICLVDDELKVIEVNCINCAGFYHCNMYKLINALENHFSKEEIK